MKQIVNVNENWAIGKKGELLCYIPEDMKFFRETTKGKILVMGRKTLDGFPGRRPLKGRVNIVLTGSPKEVQKDLPETVRLIASEALPAYAAKRYCMDVLGAEPKLLGTEEGLELEKIKNPKENTVEKSEEKSEAMPKHAADLLWEMQTETVLTAVQNEGELLSLLKKLPKDEIFVIGGATVYELLLPYCDTCLVTKNDCKIEADTFYPNLDAYSDWKETDTGEERSHEGVLYRFCRYQNRRAAQDMI